MRLSATALLVCVATSGLGLAAEPPPEDFTLQPIIGDVAVSPSGKYIAFARGAYNDRGQHGDHFVFTADYADGKITNMRQLNMADLVPYRISFKSDDRLMVTIVKQDRHINQMHSDNHNQEAKIDTSSVVAMNRDGSDIKLLMSSDNPEVSLANILVKDPKHVLLQAHDPKIGAPSLYLADITTGETSLVERGVSRTDSFRTNVDGVAYVRFDVDGRTNEVITEFRPIGGDWSEFERRPLLEQAEGGGVQGMASPNSVYVTARAGEDRRAVWEYSLTTHKPIRKVLDIPKGEAETAMIDDYRGDFVGSLYIADGMPHFAYTNKAFAAAQNALDQSFPEYPINQIVNYSKDLGVYVVKAEGPDQPPIFYILDARTMQATPVANSFDLDAADLGKTQTISYPSSDGRVITAYLTLPPHAAKHVPLVVMPHGGPEAQDLLYYDPWRQFLASRGYAVLQPEFRGSDGFGHAHEAAAHGHWGTTVQDDLTYGVKKVIDMGVADPNRMCIFGWSYGGYMAMASLTMHPDLFKCVVAGAGIADLDQMLSWESRNHGPQSESYKYWHDRMGDGDSREAGSPIKFVGQVKVPLLLVHGDRDYTVPIEQSEIMESALQSAGKSVDFLRLPKQFHTPDAPNQIVFLKKMETFLATYLK